MIKTCRICGKEFEANNPRYCTCSTECSIKNRSIVQKKYLLTHPNYNQESRDRQREKHRQRFVPCRICGENVPSVYNGKRYTRKRYHEQCVVKEALKAIAEGKNRGNNKAIIRACNTYAYTDKELREMLNND